MTENVEAGPAGTPRTAPAPSDPTSIPARANRSAATSLRMPLWNQTAFGPLARMSSTWAGMSFGRRKTLTRSTAPGMSATFR